MEKKQDMVFKEISKVFPNEELEFLRFMALTVNNTIDYSSYSIGDLLTGFINFEESENEETLTPKTMRELLGIYEDWYKVRVY
jgi:hypothetical protein